MTFVPLGKQGVGRVKDHGGKLASMLDRIKLERDNPNVCFCNTVEEGWRPCPPSLCERHDHSHDSNQDTSPASEPKEDT